MNLTAACVLIAWYSQEKWVWLLTSTWYLLSPSPMSVYLLTCIFCRWFGYNLLAGTRSSRFNQSYSSCLTWLGFSLPDFWCWLTALDLNWQGCLCLCDNATLLLQNKTFSREEKTFLGLFTQALPTGNRSLWWKGVGTRFLLRVGIMRKPESHCPLDICWKYCFCLGTTPKPGFASYTFWRIMGLEDFNNADLTLHSVSDWRHSLMHFSILEKYLLGSLKPSLGRPRPSVSCRCWRPAQMKAENPFFDLVWRWDAAG